MFGFHISFRGCNGWLFFLTMDVMTEYEGVVPDDAVAHTNVETFAGNPEVPLFKKEDNGWKGKHEPSRDHKATFTAPPGKL